MATAPALQFDGTERYYLDPELKAIVNMALAMEKPLLLTGEAGTGKTQLALEAARAMNLDTEILRAKSTIKGEEACYVQDTVLRLNDARFGSGETARVVDNFFDYIIWGPIGRAFRAGKKVVLLLDEIDKTESDVQDNLLDILEECQFTIREVNHTVKAEIRPAIFLTSNAKRELSDPFLRRCFCHHIAFPSPEQMQEILRLHFPKTSAKLMETAIAIFYELRDRGFEKPPATSELINWIGALERSGQMPNAQEPQLIGILLKRAGDIAMYREGSKGRRYL